MLPKNFPERKNERRKKALLSMDKNTDEYKNTLSTIQAGSQRSVRTKKARVVKAKIRMS